MTTLHPAFVTALRPFAPKPSVTCTQTRRGRITEYTLRGLDRAAVHLEAERRMLQIDPYRSPAVVAQMKDGAEFVEIVRYYAMD